MTGCMRVTLNTAYRPHWQSRRNTIRHQCIDDIYSTSNGDLHCPFARLPQMSDAMGTDAIQMFCLFSEYTMMRLSPTCTAEGYEKPGFCAMVSALSIWRTHLVLLPCFWGYVGIRVRLHNSNVPERPVLVGIAYVLPGQREGITGEIGSSLSGIGNEVSDLLILTCTERTEKLSSARPEGHSPPVWSWRQGCLSGISHACCLIPPLGFLLVAR